MSKHKFPPYPSLSHPPVIDPRKLHDYPGGAYPARPTIQTAIGADGVACIAYDTTGMQVGQKLGFSIAPYPHPPNESQERISSIGARGDFSHGARSGYDSPVEGVIVQAVDADGYPSPLPANWNGTLVPIVAGSTVCINVGNRYAPLPGGEMRIQVNHS